MSTDGPKIHHGYRKKSAERAPERTFAALMALFMDRESTLNEVRTVSQPIYEVFFRVRSARWFFTMVQTMRHRARNNILWLKQGKNNGLNIELKWQKSCVQERNPDQALVTWRQMRLLQKKTHFICTTVYSWGNDFVRSASQFILSVQVSRANHCSNCQHRVRFQR